MVSDPHTDGVYPVHSVVGRRRAAKSDPSDPLAVEYRVRWLGFGASYDKWLHRAYLNDIFPLLQHYDKAHGFSLAPLPLEDTPASAPVPSASIEARQRPRFRHTPPAPPDVVPTPSAPPLPTVQPTPTTDPSLPVYGPDLPDTSDKFPTGSRIDVYFARDDVWWTGTVVDSKLYQPRTAAALPERRVHVTFDDPRYAGEVFEIGLTSSIVRFHVPPRGEPTVTGAPSSTAPTLRRSARLQLL